LILFDVGANEGAYTKMLLNVFEGHNINIHLFEPSSDTFKRLNQNLEDFELILNNFGLSNNKEELVLYKSDLGSDYASIYKSEKSDASEMIRLNTLDDYCNEHTIDHIDFLKIDVEGHELRCLQGAVRMLQEHKIKYIQFEFGISNIYSRVFFKDIFDFLTNHGYEIGRILKNGVIPIKQYHHSLEVFYTTNYLAKASNR
jgi:FkbM family methyltransferase